MAETVTMPKLGFDMAEGTLVRWVVQPNEAVKKGAVLAEIETDKATVEVESNIEGTLLQHLVKEGDIVPVGDPIAVVGEPGEKVEVATPPAQAAPTTAEPVAPAAGETPPAAAPAQAAPPEQAAPAAEAEEREEAEVGLPGGVRASPLARRIAEERGIDLSRVKGSGPQGRIVRKDVEAYQPEAAPAAAAAPAAPAAAPRAGERVPLSRLRAAIGRRMAEAKQQAPHFYVTAEFDMQAVMDLRKQINGMLPEGEKISINDFLVKATALALRDFPNLNASLDGDAIVRHDQVNIGVAVAVENGLLTVVCRDADHKSLRQISQEVRAMAGRVREGKVKPEDIEGSTFSISNLGMFDVENFIAILNPPEAAILAIGSALEVPVVKDGAIVPGWRMKATISVDHRISDGAEAARFMQALKPYIEQPLLML